MFYWAKNGKAVDILNKRPRNLSTGGMIQDSPKIRNKKEDTISSLLEYGSLVVPVPVMKSGAMDDYKGPITGPAQHDKKQLGKTIVMPNELVVNKRYAKKVEDHLRRKGITLPLGE
jgi:hypothetical protein